MKIRLHEPTFGEEEERAAIEVIRSTNVTCGERVKGFEYLFGGEHAVMVNSGSSANLLAIAALVTRGLLRRGDEVIVPALCWSTTVWPLVQYGLEPVVVDIDPATMNISLEAMEAGYSGRVRAIMPVHVYGNPCSMSAVADYARKHGLLIVEDCCEALGAEPIGEEGIISTYSFYFSHHMTTFEGGMVVTKYVDLVERLRILRSHGWVRDCISPQIYTNRHPDIDPRFLFVDQGYNLRPTEIAAAVGLKQLPKLARFVRARREAAAMLTEGLERHGALLHPQLETPGTRSSWFGFPLVVDERARFTARQLRAYLEREGIETRPVICGNIARQPGLLKYPHRVAGKLDNADAVMWRGLSLPCHQDVGREQVGYMLDVIGKFVEEYA